MSRMIAFARSPMACTVTCSPAESPLPTQLRRSASACFADQAQGLILKDADRLAGPRVAQDLTPGGRGRLLGDAGRPDRGAVCERLVTVEPIHEHGIVRRHRIDPLAPRQRGSLPEGVIPVAARAPL